MTLAASLVGQRFGRLTVIAPAASRRLGAQTKAFWHCRCDCGVEIETSGPRLRRGDTRSCGCLKKDLTSARRRTHGASSVGGVRPATKEYSSWVSAKGRCYNPNNKKYPIYGGRGIAMCDAWRDDFAAFLAYLGPRPIGTTLDRIDNDGDYAPGNVRWATPQQQSANQSKTIRFRTIDDEPLCLSDVAKTLAIGKVELKRRFLRAGILRGEPLYVPSFGRRKRSA